MEVTGESVLSAVGGAATVGGVVIAWMKLFWEATLGRNNQKLLDLINGKYLPREVAEMHRSEVERRLTNLEKSHE